MRIRRNQLCPIHKSRTCCGREPIRKEKVVQVGVRRIEDPHHPRGYRELRSPAEMRKLLNRKIVGQDRICAICHFEFTDHNDEVPDHGITFQWTEVADFRAVENFRANELFCRMRELRTSMSFFAGIVEQTPITPHAKYYG